MGFSDGGLPAEKTSRCHISELGMPIRLPN